MTTVCGVDGCKGGWVAITKDLDSGEISWYLRENAHALFLSGSKADFIAIDIPIGLPEKGARLCDQQARILLGSGRRSSVFPAPIRPILKAKTYHQACDIRSRIEGKKISKQVWNIIPKIRDVDKILRQIPDLQSRVYEVHPEVCFYQLAAGHPMRFNKKKMEGRQERIAVLESKYGETIYKAMEQKRILQSGVDDILDAFAALWAAESIANGEGLVLPADPPLDHYGLKMQIMMGPLYQRYTDLNYRKATPIDLDLLAVWNRRLIQDEGHRNPMTVVELRKRMQRWLEGEYTAIIFTSENQALAYALYTETPENVYLRQFFVHADFRRRGIGRAAMQILRSEMWPCDKRLTAEVLTANSSAVSFWRAMGYKDYSLKLEIVPES